MRIIPVRCRPKTIMSTPATCARVDLYCDASWPTAVDIAPSVTNTMLKPMMNRIEFIMTLRRTLASCAFSSSTPTPEMSDTYPGTSGNTQGERKDTRPATNAAIGRGKFPIPLYCTRVGRRGNLGRYASECNFFVTERDAAGCVCKPHFPGTPLGESPKGASATNL